MYLFGSWVVAPQRIKGFLKTQLQAPPPDSSLSLAEDAELVQREYLHMGLCKGVGGTVCLPGGPAQSRQGVDDTSRPTHKMLLFYTLGRMLLLCCLSGLGRVT